MEEKHYMISDAAKMVDVESHVLRYWEEELKIDIPRNEMGHRYYTDTYIRLFREIKRLKEQGFLLKAIKMLLPDLMGGKSYSGNELQAMAEIASEEQGVANKGVSKAEDVRTADNVNGKSPQTVGSASVGESVQTIGGASNKGSAQTAGGVSMGGASNKELAQTAGGASMGSASNKESAQTMGSAADEEQGKTVNGTNMQSAKEVNMQSVNGRGSVENVGSISGAGDGRQSGITENADGKREGNTAGAKRTETAVGQAESVSKTETVRGEQGNHSNSLEKVQAEVVETRKPPVQGEKIEQFRIILGDIVSEAIENNNEVLGKEVSTRVSDSVIKEMDYLLRLKEEREEERYKKFDEVLRNYQKGNKEAAATVEKKGIFRKLRKKK